MTYSEGQHANIDTDSHSYRCINTTFRLHVHHVAFPNKGKLGKKKSLSEVTLSYS